jgi:predicted SAM-dependent methyltransferase/acetyltransferase-like isoleucine patch superfamily enzyme
MQQDEFDALLCNAMHNSNVRQLLAEIETNNIKVFGDSQRLYISSSANMVNTLFNTVSGNIYVDAFSFTGHDVSLITGTHDIQKTGSARQSDFPVGGGDIRIGKGVWICSNTVVLGPCNIADNAVVAAGSIILGGTNIGAGEFWGGSPARLIKVIKGLSEEHGNRQEYVNTKKGGRLYIMPNVSAEQILEKIKQIEMGFIVSNDPVFSEAVQEKLSAVNIRISDEYSNKARTDNSVMQTYFKTLRQQFLNADQNKNILDTIPAKTRFRFLKRVVRKLSKFITFRQQLFNKTTISLLDSFIDAFVAAQNESNAKYSELSDKYRSLNATVEKACSDLSQHLHSLSETTIANEERLRVVIETVAGNEERLQIATETVAGNEKWLQALNETVSGNERWLKSIGSKTDQIANSYKIIRDELFFELKRMDISKEKLDDADAKIKPSYSEKIEKYRKIALNLGSATIDIEGYVNVDERDLINIDVVSDVRKLPFDSDTVDEIYAAHLIEHFTTEDIQRALLPHWKDILKAGGKLTVIVPNIQFMMGKVVAGEQSFDDFKEVVFGGQEYSGDFHYSMFNTENLRCMLQDAGFVNIETIAETRRNGLCCEMEMTCTKER